MKKKFVLFFVVFIALFLAFIPGVKAESIDDVITQGEFWNKPGVFNLQGGTRNFTKLYCMPTDKFLESEEIKSIKENIEPNCKNATISVKYIIKGGGSSIPVFTHAIITDGMLTEYRCEYVYLDKTEIFYKFVYENGRYVETTRSLVNIYNRVGTDISKVYDRNEITHDITLSDTAKENNVYVGYDKTRLIGTQSIFCFNHKKELGNADTVFLISSGKPVPFEKALEGIKVTDNIDGDIPYHIINLDSYDPNTCQIGDYRFILYAYDSAGNYASRSCVLAVRDLEGPTAQNTVVEAVTSCEYEDDDFTKLLGISDPSGIKSLTYHYEDYFDSFEIPGVYNAYVDCEDNYGNTSRIEFTINVTDDTYPEVYLERGYYILAESPQTEEQIKEHILVYDNYMGHIKKFEDLDGYFSHPSVVGFYRFKVTVADSTSYHDKDYEIRICVTDNTPPTIETGGIAIVVASGTKLTNEQLKAFFQEQCPDKEIVSLTSDYLTSDLNEGMFNAHIEFAQGDSIDIVFEVKSDSVQVNNPNIGLIITLSTLGSLGLIAFVILFIAKRKRH